MRNRLPRNRNLIDYLLGELSETEREELEQKYFSDNATFIQLVETEEQLINDYLHNHLPRRERVLFEQHYLTLPCKQKKVEFAHMLNQSEARRLLTGTSKVTASRDSFLQTLFSSASKLNHPLIQSFATAVLIISIGLLIWLVRYSPETPMPPDTSGIKEIYQLKPGPDDVINEAKSEDGPIISIYLSPRSETPQEKPRQNPYLSVVDRTELIELKLKLTGQLYPRYQARLQTLNGIATELANDDSLKPETSDNRVIVVWKLNRANFSAGDYQVELQGKTAAGETGETKIYDLNIRVR